MKDVQNQAVVFFDGVCHLCNSFVDWVVARDTSRRLLFAPLQGQTAAERLSRRQRDALSSVLVWDGFQVLEKSEAVLCVFAQIPGYRWTRIARLIPLALRDRIYDFIARNRYRWFGQRETCRLPTAEEKQSLLP